MSVPSRKRDLGPIDDDDLEWAVLDGWFADQAEMLDRSDETRAFEEREAARERQRVLREPFVEVVLRCGGKGCRCVWEIHRHRESGSVIAEGAPRLGVLMTIERSGPEGSRRYRCRMCPFDRKVSTRRLAERSRHAFESGRSQIIAGVDV